MTRQETATKYQRVREAIAKRRAFRRKQAETMRELYYTRKFTQADIARMWNKGQGYISRIISGQIWT